MTKRIIAFIAIAGILGVAAFGALLMSHMTQSSHKDCWGATARQTDCPGSQNPVAYAVFHIDTYVHFFAATITVFLALTIAAFLAIQLLKQKTPRGTYTPSDIKQWTPEFVIIPRFFAFSQWLSLHENSPAFS